ncbi:hypothetical protein XH96_38225 [Bradyrhizobium sp. CCBAU 51765]|nr:hypothetical protein XH96_38225 [Bradyrhizobium sp. CCBAU 51765]
MGTNLREDTISDSHSGAARRAEPGISRFRVRCFASPRNDGDPTPPRAWRLSRTSSSRGRA